MKFNEAPNKDNLNPSSHVARSVSSLMENWEEGVETERDATLYFQAGKQMLEELGIHLDKNKKLLEVGSGNGVFLKYLQKEGYDAIGVDARPRGSDKEKVIQARIEQLPFTDESFDVVLSNSVFDTSVYDQDQSLMTQELARVLKPGGIYVGILNSDKNTPFEKYFEVLKSGGTTGIAAYRKLLV
jgi:ubiquinone/menaquinone biosynthesis C-methylase UbiE